MTDFRTEEQDYTRALRAARRLLRKGESTSDAINIVMIRFNLLMGSARCLMEDLS